MILDTSAVIAILCQEPGSGELLNSVSAARVVAIAAPSVSECHMVALRKIGADGPDLVDQLLSGMRAVIVPFGRDHLPVFLEALRKFGKGRHPSSLEQGRLFHLRGGTAGQAAAPVYGGGFFTDRCSDRLTRASLRFYWNILSCFPGEKRSVV